MFSQEEIGPLQPKKDSVTVDTVVELVIEGPYKTKSNGQLDKLFELNFREMSSYFKYDESELLCCPKIFVAYEVIQYMD